MISFDIFNPRDIQRAADKHDHQSVAEYLDSRVPDVRRFALTDPSENSGVTSIVFYVLPCGITLLTYKQDKVSGCSWDMGGEERYAKFRENVRSHGYEFAQACEAIYQFAMFPEMLLCPAHNQNHGDKIRGVIAMSYDYINGKTKFAENWAMVEWAIEAARSGADELGMLDLKTLCEEIVARDKNYQDKQSCKPQP